MPSPEIATNHGLLRSIHELEVELTRPSTGKKSRQRPTKTCLPKKLLTGSSINLVN